LGSIKTAEEIRLSNILLVGTDLDDRSAVSKTLLNSGYRIFYADNGKAALESLRTHPISLTIINGLPQESTSSIDLLRQIKEQATESSVILISDRKDVNTAVTAMKLGAADYNTDATVLIRGESGVGKGLVAELLHRQSLRRDKPFIKVNCAALPLELLESELFGYEKGAFTGAHRRKPGKFEFAHQGTIFLDEIGELGLPLQAKLLQVLQDGEFSRLGGEGDVRVDARVLASTNRNLEQAVEAGTFRNDLYYRLNVVSLTVPPLRARQEDIPLLADYFLRKYTEQYNRPARVLSPKTLAFFRGYPWPGNVRELENFVKRIVLLGTEEITIQGLHNPQVPEGGSSPLNRDPLPMAPPPNGDSAAEAEAPFAGGLKEVARRAARVAERLAIQEALKQTNWNRTQAAKLLQISYKALLYKMQMTGLSSKEHML
jgi:two-component system response regulator AtoC